MKLKTIIVLVSIFALSAAILAGEKLPHMTLKNLEKENVELSSYLGKGPVIIDFWATWCKPCLKAFPKLQKLQEKYAEKGLQIIAINEDGQRNESKIKPFIKTRRIELPVLLDENGELMRKLNIANLPGTVLVDSNGNIVETHIGFSNSKIEEIEQKLNELLNHGE